MGDRLSSLSARLDRPKKTDWKVGPTIALRLPAFL